MFFAAILVVLTLYLCETSSTNLTSVLGDYEYYIERESTVRNFEKAKQKCAQKNATLAVVNSREINVFLADEIGAFSSGTPYSFFIGLKRINATSNNNNAFQWSDGTSLSSGKNYSSWSLGEPSGTFRNKRGQTKMANCVVLGWRDFPLYQLWFNVRCNNWESRYICQKKIPRATTSSTATNSSTAASSYTAASSSLNIIAMCTVFGAIAICVVAAIIVIVVRKKRKETGVSKSVKIEEDDNGYVVANVKANLSRVNEYDFVQPSLRLVTADDKIAKMINTNTGKTAQDEDGYVDPNSPEQSEIYADETNYYSTIDTVDVSSDGRDFTAEDFIQSSMQYVVEDL